MVMGYRRSLHLEWSLRSIMMVDKQMYNSIPCFVSLCSHMSLWRDSLGFVDSAPLLLSHDIHIEHELTWWRCLSRGISVMEDEGHTSDHFSGISATDGTWHHIAVTWQSSDGLATLYDNGRKVTPDLVASLILPRFCAGQRR